MGETSLWSFLLHTSFGREGGSSLPVSVPGFVFLVALLCSAFSFSWFGPLFWIFFWYFFVLHCYICEFVLTRAMVRPSTCTRCPLNTLPKNYRNSIKLPLSNQCMDLFHVSHFLFYEIEADEFAYYKPWWRAWVSHLRGLPHPWFGLVILFDPSNKGKPYCSGGMIILCCIYIIHYTFIFHVFGKIHWLSFPTGPALKGSVWSGLSISGQLKKGYRMATSSAVEKGRLNTLGGAQNC